MDDSAVPLSRCLRAGKAPHVVKQMRIQLVYDEDAYPAGVELGTALRFSSAQEGGGGGQALLVGLATSHAHARDLSTLSLDSRNLFGPCDSSPEARGGRAMFDSTHVPSFQ